MLAAVVTLKTHYVAKAAQSANQAIQRRGFAIARKALDSFWIACEALTPENSA